jgi:hypothetical protein
LPGKLEPGSLAEKTSTSKLPEGVPAAPVPAKLSDVQNAGRTRQQPVTTASYEALLATGATAATAPAVATPGAPAARMTTTSISLPENFRLRATPGATVDPNRRGGASPTGQITARPPATAGYSPQPFQPPTGFVPGLPQTQGQPGSMAPGRLPSQFGATVGAPIAAIAMNPAPTSPVTMANSPAQYPTGAYQPVVPATVNYSPVGAPPAPLQPSFGSGLPAPQAPVTPAFR